MGVIPARLADKGGFALAMAVFALVVLAAIVAGGYFSASQEFQIGRGMKAITASFYAGESGINDVLEKWDPLVYNALAPGDSVIMGPIALEGGGNYNATVTRVGTAADSVKRYFYVEAVGRPAAPTRGERRQAVIVRTRVPQLCCAAAVTVVDTVYMGVGGGSKKIEGNNTGVLPAGWAAACTDFPPDSVAGVRTPKPPGDLVDDPGKVGGTPDIATDASINRTNVLNLGDMTYAELLEYVDHTFVGDKTFTGTVPSIKDGECDRSDPDNWGAPTNSSHPCFNYFPIIHVTGNLILAGSGVAQGILLIGDNDDADLRLTGPFEFYGLAFIMDDLELSGTVDFYGGAYVAEHVVITGSPPRFFYDKCVVERAIRESALARPRMLPDRAWVELF